MSVESMTNVSRHSTDAEFFKCLESIINFKIPSVIQNILSVTQYTSAYAFRNFDKSSLTEIETFMRNDFHVDMVPDGQLTTDFLGYYWRTQDKFKLVGGQIKVIERIARECQQLYDAEQKTNECQLLEPISQLTMSSYYECRCFLQVV